MDRFERDFERDIAEKEGEMEKLDTDYELMQKEERNRQAKRSASTTANRIREEVSKRAKGIKVNKSNMSTMFGSLDHLREASDPRKWRR